MYPVREASKVLRAEIDFRGRETTPASQPEPEEEDEYKRGGSTLKWFVVSLMLTGGSQEAWAPSAKIKEPLGPQYLARKTWVS